MRKKKSYGRKHLSLILALTLTGSLLLPLSGCGKKKDKQDISADLESIEDASDSDASEAQAVASTGDGQSFSMKTENGFDIQVTNLTIEDNLGSKPKIYELESKTMTDADVDVLAKKLFDNGEYEVVTPYTVATKDELERERDYYAELSLNAKDQYEISDDVWNALDIQFRVQDGIAETELEKDDINRTVYERQEGEILVPVTVVPWDIAFRSALMWKNIEEDTGQQALLRGMVDGRPWMLEVLCSHVLGEPTVPRVEIRAYDLLSPSTECDEYGMLTANGIASYGDKNASQEKAQAFLKKLGYGESELLFQEEQMLMVEDEMEDADEDGFSAWSGHNVPAGYRFAYGLWENDNPNICRISGGMFYPTEKTVYRESVSREAAVAPMLYVSADENGVREIDINNYFVQRTLMSENVELLSQDIIMEKVRENLAEYFDKGDRGKGAELKDFTLCLQYGIVPFSDDSGKVHFSVMPVWVLKGTLENTIESGYVSSTTMSPSYYAIGEESWYAPFGICAVDGTEVFFMGYSRSMYFRGEIYVFVSKQPEQ